MHAAHIQGMRDKNADGLPEGCSYAYGDFDLNGMIDAGDLAVLWRRTPFG